MTSECAVMQPITLAYSGTPQFDPATTGQDGIAAGPSLTVVRSLHLSLTLTIGNTIR